MKIYHLGPEGTFTGLGAKKHAMKIGKNAELIPLKSVEEIPRLLKVSRPIENPDIRAYCEAHRCIPREISGKHEAKYFKMLKEINKAVTSHNPNDDVGILATYNAREGPIMKNYDLIYRNGLYITDTEKVNIEFAIGTYPGSDGSNVIYSHEFGLMQCSEYLHKNYPNVARSTVSSTAEGIRVVKKYKRGLTIARKDALKEAGLKIIDRDIGNIVDGIRNFTEMCVISANPKSPSKNDSLTMMAITPHFDKVNLLGEILYKHIGKLGINVTRLYSRPAIDVNLGNNETPQMFYLELETNPREQRFRRCIYELSDLLNHKGKEVVRVLGSYPKP